MLSAERHSRILQLLAQRGSVRTVELAEALQVTDETIRRDLEQLDQQGLIQRIHGGAVYVPSSRQEKPHGTREIEHVEEKQAIAHMAMEFVEPGDILFLDAGSTALQLAPLLRNVAVTVVTHSHLVIAALAGSSDVRIRCCGGDFDPTSLSFTGPAALDSLRRYRFDKAFVSGNGICANAGLSEINQWQAAIKEQAILNADHICYLADHTKIGQRSDFFFASCEAIDRLITTPAADAAALEKLKATGIDIRMTPR